MKRRSFLGTVIGIVASTALPWKAEKAEGIKIPLSRAERRLKLFVEPDRMKRLKCALITDDGEKLWFPGVRGVELSKLNDVLEYIVWFETLTNVVAGFTYTQVEFVDEDNYLLNAQTLDSPCVSNGGDITICVPLQFR